MTATVSYVVGPKFPKVLRAIRRQVSAADELGEQGLFYLAAISGIPHALTQYKRETLRLIGEISFGAGALALIGGPVVIIAFLTLFSGGTIAVQGFASLGNIGIEALTGFFAAFVNVRIAAPVTAGIGLAATIGAGSTAQLGAMRISEEIDALDAMAIRSVPYLVSTRVIAGIATVIPMYALAVLMSFLASRFTVTFIFGQSAGVYDHYFGTFLNPVDVLWSFGQAIAMGVAVMLIHTYYGFNASGGPAGVGLAVGRSVRTSLIVVVTITLLISLVAYGTSGNFHLSA